MANEKDNSGELLETLQKMTSYIAVAGFEHLSGFADWYRQQVDAIPGVNSRFDKMGNLLALKGADPKLAIFVHMDTVGYMISSFAGEDINLGVIGGPAAKTGTRMVAVAQDGTQYDGFLIAQQGENRNDHRASLDIGLPDPEQALEIGDIVGYKPNFAVNRHEDVIRIVSSSLDNKIGCLVGLEVLKQADNIALAATVREEGGGPSAAVAAAALQPDLAIVVDITYDENLLEPYHIRMGDGVVVTLKDAMLPDIPAARRMIALARELNIPVQPEVVDGGSSDGAQIYKVGAGVPWFFVGIPIRYSHHPTEIAALEDIEAAISLIIEFARRFIN